MPSRDRVHYADDAPFVGEARLPAERIFCRVPAARYQAADRCYPTTADTNRVTCGSCRRMLRRLRRGL